MTKKKNLPIDEIVWLHEEKGMTYEEIADIYDCGKTTIGRRMQEYRMQKEREAELERMAEELRALARERQLEKDALKKRGLASRTIDWLARLFRCA